MSSGLRSETPQEVSCTVRNLFWGTFPRCETRFGRCERLFWDSRPEDPKSLLAPSLKHFWAFWLFRHLYQASGVATLDMNGKHWLPHLALADMCKFLDVASAALCCTGALRHVEFRCSKLEPFCDTETWAHLANLG